MAKYKINNFLICITSHTTPAQIEQIFTFLEWKKNGMDCPTLGITTHGRASYTLLNELIRACNEKGFPIRSFYPASMPEPNVATAYKVLDFATSFQYYENGILLISDISLEDLFKPIQIWMEFIDPDFGGEKDNQDFLVEFVLAYRQSPHLVIYDARSLRFVHN